MKASFPRIGIVGAGAIGCTLATRLACSGHSISLLARGAALQALRRDGVRLTDRQGHHRAAVAASDSGTELGEQDLLFLCAKAHDLPALLPTIEPMLGAGTVVVPVVNGVPWWYFLGEGGRFAGRHVEAVDPGGRLAARLAPPRLIGCVAFVTAESPAPGMALTTNPLRMVFGEPDDRPSRRLERLCALLASAGIEARASERIRDPLWTKIIANLSSNPLSVISGATLEEIYTSPDLHELVCDLLHEGLRVAAAYGARVELDLPGFLAHGAAMGAVRTSMLQDHARGRPLELAAIGGAVLELAARLDIALPRSREIIALARFCGRRQRPIGFEPSSTPESTPWPDCTWNSPCTPSSTAPR
ncbi:ketopantoate reductase family protein [Azotobacter vinelandii]|uniref:ketopantoate reductase family protein n=1 Tax=Azotobacter vinelandii TaxID=354 RepID=UPI0026669999|nr:2-dehydropantoate 2-reductase [Azotobacter vinelandii]WKN21425.1 2-dehydropantoate 2-reductase [Azotobacter vinelandii]